MKYPKRKLLNMKILSLEYILWLDHLRSETRKDIIIISHEKNAVFRLWH